MNKIIRLLMGGGGLVESLSSIYSEHSHVRTAGSLPGIFSGGGAKSFVMLLFSDQISGRGKSLQGGKLPQGAHPCGRKPD